MGGRPWPKNAPGNKATGVIDLKTWVAGTDRPRAV
jgi:hypothetical protein